MKFISKSWHSLWRGSSGRMLLLSGVAVIAIAACLAIASFTLRADTTTTASFQAEAGTKTGNVTQITDAAAAGGNAVQFNAPSTGGFQANCIVKPSDCGYPDATNTGVPAGTTLTNSGTITVTQAGAVVQNLNINGGQINIRANNVTIKKTRITTCAYYPIDYPDNYTGLVVEDTEIDSTCSQTTAAMSFGNFTARRMNVHGSSDGFKANANSLIEDSYIHDLAVTADSHNDGVQSTGGNNVTLRHNTFDLKTQGVCVQFGSSNTGWLVTDNLMNCTGWMLNGSNGTSNSTFTNNRFTRLNGAYGPASLGGSGNTWSGNYYDDNGAVANQ
jgi:hypothetical protein